MINNKYPRKLKKKLKKAYNLEYCKKHNIIGIVVTYSFQGNKLVFYKKPMVLFIKKFKTLER